MNNDPTDHADSDAPDIPDEGEIDRPILALDPLAPNLLRLVYHQAAVAVATSVGAIGVNRIPVHLHNDGRVHLDPEAGNFNVFVAVLDQEATDGDPTLIDMATRGNMFRLPDGAALTLARALIAQFPANVALAFCRLLIGTGTEDDNELLTDVVAADTREVTAFRESSIGGRFIRILRTDNASRVTDNASRCDVPEGASNEREGGYL